MKRIFALVSLILAAAMLLSACGNSSTPAATTAVVPASSNSSASANGWVPASSVTIYWGPLKTTPIRSDS